MSAPNVNHPTVAGVINDEEKNGEEEKEENEPLSQGSGTYTRINLCPWGNWNDGYSKNEE